MKINKNKAKLNCGDLAATWPQPGGELAATWPGPGRDLVASWPPGGCAFSALPGLDLRWAIGHKTKSVYGKCMGNAWEMHGKHMEGLAWPSLAWLWLAWTGLVWPWLAWFGLACATWRGLGWTGLA